MMHHAVPRGTVVHRGTALCSATLHPPEVKSCRIIWCIVQREHIVENLCNLLGLKCFQRLLSMQFIQNKSFWTFYCASYKDILHISNPNTAPKNKINNWTKWRIFTLYPGAGKKINFKFLGATFWAHWPNLATIYIVSMGIYEGSFDIFQGSFRISGGGGGGGQNCPEPPCMFYPAPGYSLCHQILHTRSVISHFHSWI